MRIIFDLNDNTGTCKVIFYQKDQDQLPTALRNFEYKQYMYVKIFGSVRVYKEEKAIVGTHIRPIEKFEEITNHFLQTFVAHQIRTQGVLTVTIIIISILFRARISRQLSLHAKVMPTSLLLSVELR
jgi:hypothetical protein